MVEAVLPVIIMFGIILVMYIIINLANTAKKEKDQFLQTTLDRWWDDGYEHGYKDGLRDAQNKKDKRS